MKSQGAGDKPSYREKQKHVSQWEQWKKLEKKVERIQNIIQVNVLRKIDETFQRTEALRNGFNTALKKIEDNRQQQVRGMKEEIRNLIWGNKKEAREEMMNEQQRMKSELEEQLKIRDQAAAGINEKVDKQLKEIRGEMQKTKERINTLRTDLSIDNNLLEMPEAEWTILPGAFTKNFSVRGNTITLDKYVDGWQQILLDVTVGRVFAFRTHVIRTRGAQLMVGLVDALTQQHQQFSSASTNAICYGAGGAMSYGQLGKKETKYTGDGLGCGTDILVQVHHSTVTFTITHNSVSSRHELHSGLLAQPNRRFVPFVQMWHKGDTVSCHLE